MTEFISNLFKRLMYLYRKEGDQAFDMASYYLAGFGGSLVILVIFLPISLYFHEPFANPEMDYLERKGRLLPFVLPVFILFVIIVKRKFKEFKVTRPESFKDIWPELNLFHIWLIWLLSFLFIFYSIKDLME
jgi:hypothetical protein